MSSIRIVERHLSTKHNLPEDFTFYRWECFPKGQNKTIYVEYTGGRFEALKSGKRKGKPNWNKPKSPSQVFVVTVEEEAKIMDAYEIETGNCSCCMGSGKTVAKISISEGTTYRPCSQCRGSGKRRVAESAV